jgi:hypothetical protein
MTTFARQVCLGWLVAAGLVRRHRQPLLVALGVGPCVGLASYVAGPLVASLTSGWGARGRSLPAGTTARWGRLMSRLERRRG